MPYIHSLEKKLRSFILQKSLSPLESICRKNYTIDNTTSNEDVKILFKKLKECDSSFDLIRIGEPGDGSYIIPNDLGEIKHCISLGYGGIMTFENHLATLGIDSVIVDPVVPENNLENVIFVNKFIGSTSESERRTITLSDLIKNYIDGEDGFSSDLILQMDIELDEWLVLNTLSTETLLRFRILIIEFHSLHLLRHKWIFSKVISPIIENLTKNHYVAKLEITHGSGMWSLNGKEWFPDTIEVTFHRRDRKSTEKKTNQIRYQSISGLHDRHQRRIMSFEKLMQENC
jgi:hypothetical protein